MGRDSVVTETKKRSRRLCPVCRRRPVIYDSALGCCASCDFVAREVERMKRERQDPDPFETDPDPFELP